MSKHNVQSKEHAQHEALKKSEVEQFVDFFKQNGKSLALIVVLAVVLSLGIARFRQGRQLQHQEAMLMLTEAQQTEHLEALIDAFPKTPAAVVAQLELASLHYSRGEYSEAMEVYRTFRQAYPRHDLASSTLLAEALCLEALGNYGQALEQIDAFLENHPDHFLTPPALLARGRCLELAGRAEESRAVFEQFIEEYADTPWAQEAEESLRRVQFLMRSLARPRTPPALGVPELVPPPVDLPAVDMDDVAIPPVEPEVVIEPEAAPEPETVVEPEVVPEPETEVSGEEEELDDEQS